MDPILAEKLERLPRLAPARRTEQSTQCKLCGSRALFFDIVDFAKCCNVQDVYAYGCSDIPVAYHKCEACGFLFTRFMDDWRQEDLARFIYNDDYIKVDGDYESARPLAFADDMARRFAGCEQARILDYGSGTGVFADRMVALGYTRTESYDPFTTPERPTGVFDIITCFEVLEHTADPKAMLGDMAALLAGGGCIVFSQTLQPADIDEVLGAWWYLAPRNGHVSTYTAQSLAVLGEQAGLSFHGRDSPYAFSRPSPSELTRRALATIGPAFGFRRLLAPSAHRAPGWNSPEWDGAVAFRWTSADRVSWTVAPPLETPCLMRVETPFIGEIQPGFAARCTLALGGREQPVRIEGGRLATDIEVTESVTEAVLTTPPPLSPRALGTAPLDTRPLGLCTPMQPT